MEKNRSNTNQQRSTINVHSTIGEWVAKYPVTFRVFCEFDIDICFGGFMPLQDVCQEKNIDSWVVLEKLMDAISEIAKLKSASRSQFSVQRNSTE